MPTLTNLLFLVLLIQGPIALQVAVLHPVPRVLVRSPQFRVEVCWWLDAPLFSSSR